MILRFLSPQESLSYEVPGVFRSFRMNMDTLYGRLASDVEVEIAYFGERIWNWILETDVCVTASRIEWPDFEIVTEPEG